MAVRAAQVTDPGRAGGREAWGLLWRASRPLSALVLVWLGLGAVLPALVVTTLGVVVADVPGAVRTGLTSTAGHRLEIALVVAAGVYALSLVLDPVGNALGTAARARITGALQGRLLAAVSSPVGVDHLEDPTVLDRLARAEGSLTGFFPGDAPVTWVGVLASRLSGVLGCAVVAWYSWWLGVLLLVTWLVVRRIVLHAVQRQATDLRGQTLSMRRAWYFTGVGAKPRDAKEVRVFGLADFLARRFREEFTDSMRNADPGLRDLHVRATTCFLAVLAVYCGALLVIADDARTHAIDLRSLVILLPMLAVTRTAGSVSYADITLAWTLAGLPDVDTLERDLQAAAPLPGSAPVGTRPARCVRFVDVSFRYPAGDRDVLAHLDLELVAGTSTAIVGVNGAGKSTLVSLLARLRDPSSGAITVDGTDVTELDAHGWQRTVALMPQEPARYPVSAYDNIAFGAIEHRDDVDGVHEAAHLAGFDDVLPYLPDGWGTVLARELPGGVDLSGGQWQRLALARALFATRHGARLLVLDEPTAALDVRSEAAFYGRFLDITAGLTTVVISHRFATVRRASTICVLDGGAVSERGSHDELVAAGGTYARLYATQAARFGR